MSGLDIFGRLSPRMSERKAAQVVEVSGVRRQFSELPDLRPLRRALDLTTFSLGNSGTAATATLDAGSPFGVTAVRVEIPNGNTYTQLTVSGLTIPGFSTAPGKVVWVIYFEDPSVIAQCQSIIGDAGFAQSNNLTYNIANSDRYRWAGVHVIEHAATLAYAVTDLRIRVFGGSVPSDGIGRFWLLGVYVPEPKKPFVCFTVDDAALSMFTDFAPSLETRGWHATFGIQQNAVGTNPALYVNEAQLSQIYAAGHDLAPHNVGNLAYLTDQTLSEYIADYATCKSWLATRGWTRGGDYHPFVQGRHDAALVNALAAQGCRVMRTASAGRNESSIRSQFAPVVVAERSLSSTTTIAAAKGWVDDAITHGQDIVFMAHDIVAAAPTGVQWARADWLELLNYVQSKQYAGLLGGVGSVSEMMAHRGYL